MCVLLIMQLFDVWLTVWPGPVENKQYFCSVYTCRHEHIRVIHSIYLLVHYITSWIERVAVSVCAVCMPSVLPFLWCPRKKGLPNRTCSEVIYLGLGNTSVSWQQSPTSLYYTGTSAFLTGCTRPTNPFVRRPSLYVGRAVGINPFFSASLRVLCICGASVVACALFDVLHVFRPSLLLIWASHDMWCWSQIYDNLVCFWVR